MSMPIVCKPLRANSTASGSPTYPSPTTPTRAVRSWIRRRSVTSGASGLVSRSLQVMGSPLSAAGVRDDEAQGTHQIWSRGNDVAQRILRDRLNPGGAGGSQRHERAAAVAEVPAPLHEASANEPLDQLHSRVTVDPN